MRKNDPHQKTTKKQPKKKKKGTTYRHQKVEKSREKNLIGQIVKPIETEGYAMAYRAQKICKTVKIHQQIKLEKLKKK